MFISPLRQNTIQCIYKYRIKTSKNNKKKKKPTVPDRYEILKSIHENNCIASMH